MTEKTSEKPRPRDVMPAVWAAIGRSRETHGDAHVTECIRRGMAGEPDWFYAFEGGHVVGTPFTVDSEIVKGIQFAAALGGKSVMVMRNPAQAEAATNGAA